MQNSNVHFFGPIITVPVAWFTLGLSAMLAFACGAIVFELATLVAKLYGASRLQQIAAGGFTIALIAAAFAAAFAAGALT